MVKEARTRCYEVVVLTLSHASFSAYLILMIIRDYRSLY